MEASERTQTNGQSNERKCSTINKVNGLNNWMQLFLVIFIFHYIIDNITSYGIIKSPVQLTYDFIEFMQASWWFFAFALFSFLIQIVMCFLNEKALAMGNLSETLGMALHFFISLFSNNLCSIVFSVYKFNPVASVVVMIHLFINNVKFWGYAHENRKLRMLYKRNTRIKHFEGNGKAGCKGAVKYPENVTLKDIFQFMVCTVTWRYNVNCYSIKSRNLKKLLLGILQMIFIYYATAFIIYQCILPELDKVAVYISSRQYLKVFGSALKLALPVDIAWLLFFYFYFHKLYINLYGWFWGTEHVVGAQDWWNSENSTVFWTKWNRQVHLWFKECFFLPVIQMGYSKLTAGLVIACFSGLIHEYMITIPSRSCYGCAALCMLGQIPHAYISAYAQRSFGAKWGNLVLWFNLIFGHTITIIIASATGTAIEKKFLYRDFIEYLPPRITKTFEMKAAAAVQSDGQSNEQKCHTNDKVNGINNWMLLFFAIFVVHYLIENITTYGIVTNPIQLTQDFIEFMQVNWWYFTMVIFVGGVVAVVHIFLLSLKFLGYAFENRKLRNIYKRNIATENFNDNRKSEGKGTVKYPDNVNLNNIFQFMICTAACRYRLNCPPRRPANYQKFSTGIVQIILIHYAVAIIIYQFILPEVDKTATYIDKRQYVQVFGSVLKLALPVNITWIMYLYLYVFKLFLPLFGWFWGVEDIVVARDWWNSENSTVFWTKWNYLAHMVFKEYLFLPLLEIGYSKRTVGIGIACFSGLLHEYMATIPCRSSYGGAAFIMISQIPIAGITAYVQRQYGAKWGNLVLWSSLIFGFSICVIIVYYNYTAS